RSSAACGCGIREVRGGGGVGRSAQRAAAELVGCGGADGQHASADAQALTGTAGVEVGDHLVAIDTHQREYDAGIARGTQLVPFAGHELDPGRQLRTWHASDELVATGAVRLFRG